VVVTLEQPTAANKPAVCWHVDGMYGQQDKLANFKLVSTLWDCVDRTPYAACGPGDIAGSISQATRRECV
jgi:hypothetical protein